MNYFKNNNLDIIGYLEGNKYYDIKSTKYPVFEIRENGDIYKIGGVHNYYVGKFSNDDSFYVDVPGGPRGYGKIDNFGHVNIGLAHIGSFQSKPNFSFSNSAKPVEKAPVKNNSSAPSSFEDKILAVILSLVMVSVLAGGFWLYCWNKDHEDFKVLRNHSQYDAYQLPMDSYCYTDYSMEYHYVEDNNEPMVIPKQTWVPIDEIHYHNGYKLGRLYYEYLHPGGDAWVILGEQ